MAVEQTSTISWYLRMFSYLLMICGLFGLAVGGVVIYGAFADGRPPQRAPAFRPRARRYRGRGQRHYHCGGSSRTRGLAQSGARGGPSQPRFGRCGRLGVRVGAVLCHGGQLPTSLIFNLLLMAICVVIAGNLGKSAQ